MSPIVAVLLLLLSFYYMSKIVDEYFLKTLDTISHWLKLTPSVAGATLMAFGTSAPELSTALIAMFLPNFDPSTGLGAIVGSAIFQILVVIGFAAFVKTSYLDWRPVVRDFIFYGITIILLVIFVSDGNFILAESLTFFGVYICYLIMLFFWSRKIKEKIEQESPLEMIEEKLEEKKDKKLNFLSFIFKIIDLPLLLVPKPNKKNNKMTIFVFVLSLAIIGGLSYFLVLGAENIARYLGIPTVIIALTILAGGTSIPEVIASAIVAKQGRGDMAISNAIGSNIFDVLMSLGFPILLYNIFRGDLINIGDDNINSSLFLLFATLAVVLMIFIFQKFKANRLLGSILIGTYVLYVIAAYGGLI